MGAANAIGSDDLFLTPFHAADRFCCWRVGSAASTEGCSAGAATVGDRTERNHSDNGHTVSPLVHLGQRGVPAKMISHSMQKSARPSQICP
jgi:hypothetical protein